MRSQSNSVSIDSSGSEVESDVEVLESKDIKELLKAPPPDIMKKRGIKFFTCPICFDPPEITAVAPCGHMICSDCIYQSLAATGSSTNRKGQCPMCRKPVAYRDIKFLEFRTEKAKLITPPTTRKRTSTQQRKRPLQPKPTPENKSTVTPGTLMNNLTRESSHEDKGIKRAKKSPSGMVNG